MIDLIDRQAVLDCLCACFEEVNYGDNDDAIALLGYAMHYVKQMPTIEPKRGEWIRVRVGPYQHTYGMRCSHCDATYMLSFECEEYFKAKAESTHYCSNCGAKMNIRSNNNESYD